MTVKEYNRQSDYFKYGYDDAISGKRFYPTNGHLGVKIGHDSYVYGEYKRGYAEGEKDL